MDNGQTNIQILATEYYINICRPTMKLINTSASDIQCVAKGIWLILSQEHDVCIVCVMG